MEGVLKIKSSQGSFSKRSEKDLRVYIAWIFIKVLLPELCHLVISHDDETFAIIFNENDSEKSFKSELKLRR